jgi:hypothetical protein
VRTPRYVLWSQPPDTSRPDAVRSDLQVLHPERDALRRSRYVAAMTGASGRRRRRVGERSWVSRTRDGVVGEIRVRSRGDASFSPAITVLVRVGPIGGQELFEGIRAFASDIDAMLDEVETQEFAEALANESRPGCLGWLTCFRSSRPSVG